MFTNDRESKVRISLVTVTYRDSRFNPIPVWPFVILAFGLAVIAWTVIAYMAIFAGNLFLNPNWPYDFKHVAGVAVGFALLHGILHRD